MKKEGQFKKGRTPWNKGKKGLQKAWNKGLSGYGAGEAHWRWKGERVGYLALHDWVRRQLGKPTYCSNDPSHIAKRFVWGNISGEYKRDLSDWHSLCNSCNLRDRGVVRNQFDEQRLRRLYA